MPKLFATDIPAEAQLKYCVTGIRSDAHAVIHQTTDQWAATDPLVWFWTDIRSEADKLACKVDSAFDADIVVYFTDIASDAEWLDGSKSVVF